jgi:hypothetical protein
MELYLHVKSEHHLSQKQAALKMLSQWARTLCDAESLDWEIKYLKRTFRQSRYSNLDIKNLLVPKQELAGIAVL